MSKIPQNICRICEKINELINILQSEHQWLIDKYISCANVTFDINDELPKYFCKNCIENLQSAHEFKEKCEFTHNKFMKFVENSIYEDDADNEKPKIQSHTNVIVKLENEYDEIHRKTEENHINVGMENNYDDAEKLINVKIEVLKDNQNKLLLLKLMKSKRTYECYMCPTIKFRTKLAIERHMRNVHEFHIENNSKKSCNLCDKTYTDISSLIRHRKRVHLGIKFKNKRTDTPCEYCNMHFATVQNKNRHVRTVHLGEKLFSCTLCGNSYGQLHHLKVHQARMHDAKRFKCEHCPNVYATKNSFLLHIRKHLSADVDDQQSLTILRKPKERHVKQEPKIKSEQKRVVCEICGKSISVSSMLGHRLMHEDIKPEKCTICLKSFRTKHALKVHAQMHTNISPYKCDICGKTFRRQPGLSAHIKRHSGLKPYKCIECNKQFSLPFNLRLHARIHSGEKPYCCEFCSKKFSNSGALRKHITVHQNDHQSMKQDENKVASIN